MPGCWDWPSWVDHWFQCSQTRKEYLNNGSIWGLSNLPFIMHHFCLWFRHSMGLCSIQRPQLTSWTSCRAVRTPSIFSQEVLLIADRWKSNQTYMSTYSNHPPMDPSKGPTCLCMSGSARILMEGKTKRVHERYFSSSLCKVWLHMVLTVFRGRSLMQWLYFIAQYVRLAYSCTICFGCT